LPRDRLLSASYLKSSKENGLLPAEATGTKNSVRVEGTTGKVSCRRFQCLLAPPTINGGVKANKESVMAAVEKNGLALDVADKKRKEVPEIVVAAAQKGGDAFSHVPKTGTIWEDNKFVLPLVEK